MLADLSPSGIMQVGESIEEATAIDRLLSITCYCVRSMTGLERKPTFVVHSTCGVDQDIGYKTAHSLGLSPNSVILAM